MVMGSASRGPLLLFSREGKAIIDPYTLRPSGGQQLECESGSRGALLRMSADGHVLVVNHAVFQYTTTGFKRCGLAEGPVVRGHMTPGPEGRGVYTACGVFTPDGKPVGKLGSYSDGSRFCLPVTGNESLYLSHRCSQLSFWE